MSTPTSKPQQRIELPPSVLRCLRAIGASDLTSGDQLIGALILIFGWAWYERQPSVDPSALSLPEGQ